jgi:hypothetical protein
MKAYMRLWEAKKRGDPRAEEELARLESELSAEDII